VRKEKKFGEIEFPYVSREMRKRDFVEEAHVFNRNCGITSARTKDLDEIVAKDRRSGAIHFPASSAA
jgi:hypothetical protein